MIEKWYVIFWIVCISLRVGAELGLHGKQKPEWAQKYNGIAALFGAAIAVTIAYFGGLFSAL